MICSKNDCVGCFSCYNICPQDAIKMIEDEYGNIYPKIIDKKCIKCNMCKKVCPSINKFDGIKPKEAYAVYNKNEKIRMESTSGAAATTFYLEVLSKGGVVYGASNIFNNDRFKFIRIEKQEDLYKVKGSKYVHCYMEDNLKKIKNDLNSKKNVLFIGTPCQVAGVKSFLSKDYDNLTTIDIICHGVPSQKLLFEDLKLNGIRKEDMHYISFRDADGYSMKVYKELDKKKYQYETIFNKVFQEDSYYKNFLKGNICRPNCYKCKYAVSERISDITIGDFWRYKKYF